ncbi:thioredoxin family protein [bacterium]|jgi:thioredoxin 1|nr:thioredoxin family protein [bacterium]
MNKIFKLLLTLLIAIYAQNALTKAIEVTSKKHLRKLINDKKPLVIEWYADFCGACKRMIPIFEVVSENMKNVNFAKAETSKFQSLSQKLNIEYLPTIMVLVKGKEVAKKVGYVDRKQMKEFVKNAITTKEKNEAKETTKQKKKESFVTKLLGQIKGVFRKIKKSF